MTVLVALVALGQPAGAVNYFVSMAGHDGATGTALADPWYTIGRAASVAAPGDTVFIRGGSYTETLEPKHSGTQSARITYRAFGDETVTLTGVDYGILLKGLAYITIDGIDCLRTQRYLLIDDSHHITIQNCVFDESLMRTGGPKGIRIVNNSHHNRIQRCWIGRAGYVAVAASSKTGLEDCGGLINIGNDTAPDDNSHYNLIQDNTLAYGSHHVLLIGSSFNVIRRNLFHNEAWMTDPSDPERLYGNRCIGGGGPNSAWNLIEDNLIAMAGPPPDDDGAYGIERASPSNIIRGNALYLNGTAGIGLHSKWHGAASDNHVYSNTFYRNGEEPTIEDFHKGGISIQNYNGEAPTGNVIKNNLFHRNTVPADRFHQLGVFALGGNVDLGAQVVAGNWKEAGDPLFEDADRLEALAAGYLPGFELRPGSPCIDAGVFLTVTTGAGSGRAIGVADVGYFTDGWGIIEGDLIQLEGGTQRARVTGVDRQGCRLLLDRDLTWTDGQGVALAWVGERPDIGAHEFGAQPRPAP